MPKKKSPKPAMSKDIEEQIAKIIRHSHRDEVLILWKQILARLMRMGVSEEVLMKVTETLLTECKL